MNMHLAKKIVLTVLVWLTLSTALYADAYLYDESRWLSNNQVNQITKDRTGLLWIATNSGLNSFDGYAFKEATFFKKKVINSFCYDSTSHALWVGTDDGLFKYELKTQQVKAYTNSTQSVQRIYMYKGKFIVQFLQGDIAEVGWNGVMRKLFNLQSVGVVRKNFRNLGCIDLAGNLYLAVHDYPHLLTVNVNTGKHRILTKVLAKDVWNVSLIDGTCVLACMRKGLQQLSQGKSDILLQNSIQQEHKFSMIYKFKHEYYALIRGFYGIYQFNTKSGKWRLLESDNDVSFRSKNISTVFRDAHDVLWVGTNKGLIKMTLDIPCSFKTLFDGYLPFVSTRQIIEKNKDELFVATINGIYQYNLRNLKAKLIDSTEFDTVFPIYTRALYYANGRYLYAGTETHENFIYRVDLPNDKCEGGFYTKWPAQTKVSSVFSMYKGIGATIWLATDKGLATYNEEKKTVSVFLSGKFNTHETRLFYVAKSSIPGKFWAAGRASLFLVDEQNGIERTITRTTSPFKLVDDDYIFVGEDVKHKLWVATKKSGMFILDFATQTTEVLTNVQGLSANEVYGILWQDDNIGWISTVNGLCRYDTRTKTFNNYFLEDGISDNEFNQNSLFKGSDGTFYFGGINGINYFNPKDVKPIADKLTIFSASAVKWNESEQAFIEVNTDGQIRMNPQDHLLSLTFGLSDYSNTQGCTFFYKIEGLYNNWVSLGNQNMLRLNSLPAGNYHIEIMGYNKRGIRSTNILSYNLEIIQVFYKTWWFYVLLAMSLVLLVYGYFKWRLQNINQKLKLRTQIASNLHDEVGSLLTSIIISTDSARYASDTADEKDIKLEKISSLSRVATSTMSDVLWSIDARNDYAGNLTDRMREHAEAMLVPLGIEVEFDLSAAQQNQNIAPEIRQQLYLVFKEAINNIVKHASATLVQVYYMQQGKKFRLRIENNNDSKVDPIHSTGQGLKNMHMRAAKINAKCEVYRLNSKFVIEVCNE